MQDNDQGDRGNVVAIDEAMQRWQEKADEEERQYGLFAEPLTEAGKAKAALYYRGSRGRGRPFGSRNKRTERTVAFLLSRHRDPREILLEMAQANVHDLAALLGCSPFEAYQEKRLAAIGVLPYIAQRQPLAVDFTKRSVIYLTINEGVGGAEEVPEVVQLGTVIDGKVEIVVGLEAEGPSAQTQGITLPSRDDHS